MRSPLDRRGPVAVKPWIPPPLSVLLSRRIFARRANFSSSSLFSSSSSIGCLGSITRTRTRTRTIRLRLRRSVSIRGGLQLNRQNSAHYEKNESQKFPKEQRRRGGRARPA